MKNLAAIGLFAIWLGSSTAFPADSRDRRTPAPTPEAKTAAESKATPTPTAAPTPKKRSFLQKLNPFGGGKPKATPTATPAPAPKPETKKAEPAEPKATPTKKKRHVDDADAEPTPKPRAKKSTPEPKATPQPTAAPTPEETPTAAPKSTPKVVAAPVIEPESTPIYAPGIDEDAIGKSRYRAAKIQALQDPAIAKLQDKADTAKDEDAQRSLTKAYYRALFDKMRAVDPTIKERIDRMEAATLKRLQTTPGDE